MVCYVVTSHDVQCLCLEKYVSKTLEHAAQKQYQGERWFCYIGVCVCVWFWVKQSLLDLVEELGLA